MIKETPHSVPRPGYANKNGFSEEPVAEKILDFLNSEKEPTAPVAPRRPEFKIANRDREVSFSFGSYTFKKSIFETEMPAHSTDRGLYIQLEHRNTKGGCSYLFVPRFLLSTMMDCDERMKDRAILAFADQHYETFKSLIADINKVPEEGLERAHDIAGWDDFYDLHQMDY